MDVKLFFKRLGIALGVSALMGFGVVFANPETYTSLGTIGAVAALLGVGIAAGLAKLVDAIKSRNP